MNKGKACAIFRNLTSDEYSISEKALAIHTVLQMETINGITKVELCNALKWLWNSGTDWIKRSDAIDAIRAMQTYKMFAGDDTLLIDQAGAQTELMLLPSIQSGQRWIPCSEQMPEEGSWALWCSKTGRRQVARWKTDVIDHFYPHQRFFELEDAVAWMPLPEPYRSE